eukprot:GHVU01004355.1.p1 GENE.GHVU01004355.1~~GHVU01004355.1.p1  ORF type:complete len:329 (-),score=53.96 GHVU01004355.1:1731-2717(-)
MGKTVCVIGAAGGIGSVLAFLLKKNVHVGDLRLYDLANIGVATDLSHICCAGNVTGFQGPSDEEMKKALKNADFVIVPAGFPRLTTASGEIQDRNALFTKNADIISSIAKNCAEACPGTHLLIITNPVNSTVPVAREVMRKNGVPEPKVYGVTKLDEVRAKTFLGEAVSISPSTIEVTVLGGHSQKTMVPLLSSAKGVPKEFNLTDEIAQQVTDRIKKGGDAVYAAKDYKGTAQLSMAYSADVFFTDLVECMLGHNRNGCVTYAYDPSFTQTHGYRAAKMQIDQNGKCGVFPDPKLSPLEEKSMEEALAQVKTDVETAYAYLNMPPPL